MRIAQLPSQGRAAILWGIVFFCLAQLGLGLFIERRRPDWGDPEYGRRLLFLREKIRAEPNRPLFLILGSSRIGNGFNSDILPPTSWSTKESPIVFNMSQSGGTTLYELLILKRLLVDGIRPRWIVIEAYQTCLNWQARDLANKDAVPADKLHWNDLKILNRYAPQHRWHRYRKWLVETFLPCYTDRRSLLAEFAPSWLTPQNAYLGHYFQRYLSSSGWFAFPIPVSAQQHEKWLEMTRASFRDILADFHVCPEADRIFREMLEICRRENIAVIGLVEMPVESSLRNVYSQEAHQTIETYFTDLCREYDTKLIDASTWLPDEGNFSDGHHILPEGAKEFTLRFWKEALEPRLRDDCSQSVVSQKSQSGNFSR
jgi:hypothetical protein